MKKTGKIISFNTGKEIENKSQEELDEEYFEEQGFEFEGWEEEYELVEAEDWDGLIEYYNSKIERGQTEHCIQVADIYIEHFKQYQKAIDYLLPFYEKFPENETIKQEIELAQNFIAKKEIKLTKQQIQKSSSKDVDILGLFDEEEDYCGYKDYKKRLNEIFKKYSYLVITTDNTIYGIKGNTREKITKNREAYISAHEIYYF